jgi:hypothetical protein
VGMKEGEEHTVQQQTLREVSLQISAMLLSMWFGQQ